MTILGSFNRRMLTGLCLLMTVSGWIGARAEERAQEAAKGQKSFDSPEDGVTALMKACEEKDKEALHAIFGPMIEELKSGDEVQDRQHFEEFARRLATKSRVERQGEGTAVLHIGAEDHPFAVPLVKAGGKWRFDTEAGLEEIVNRRVGENELNAIRVCKGYVAAQRDYLLEDHDGDGVMEYAQLLASTPGKKDGLYWEAGPDERPSPLGPLLAAARAEGYGRSSGKDPAGSGDGGAVSATRPGRAASAQPYHGYLYKVLIRQGEHAPGGRFDYTINGHMVAGFALVAWPAEWGSSGVMTFIVNSNGKVLQKNLGEKTVEAAGKIDVYDPDNSWAAAEK